MYEACAYLHSIKLHWNLTVSSATEKICDIWRLPLAGFFHFRMHCFLQTLEAPADFTILVLSTK